MAPRTRHASVLMLMLIGNVILKSLALMGHASVFDFSNGPDHHGYCWYSFKTGHGKHNYGQTVHQASAVFPLFLICDYGFHLSISQNQMELAFFIFLLWIHLCYLPPTHPRPPPLFLSLSPSPSCLFSFALIFLFSSPPSLSLSRALALSLSLPFSLLRPSQSFILPLIRIPGGPAP